MNIHIHIHHHPDEEGLRLLRRIDQRTAKMDDTLDTVLASVTAQGGRLASLEALVEGLAAQLEANAANPEKILAIANALRNNDGTIQAAFDAGDQDPNTPAPTP